MAWFSDDKLKYYRATVTSSNQLTFVTNPLKFPVMDGDLVYVDTSQTGVPIIAHSNSAYCCQVQLLIDVEEVIESTVDYLNANAWTK